MAKEANIIVNGLPIEVTKAGRCTAFLIDQEEWPLLRTRIRLQVENVLKGSVGLDQLNFYRYEWCGDYIRNGTPEWNAIREGERSVFFLEPVGTEFRAFSDYTYTRLSIFTGYHTTEEIRGESVPEQIFWLMLTPGPQTDSELFA